MANARIERLYHRNGAMRWEGHVDEAGKRVGLWNHWDNEGVRRSQGIYVDGRRHGLWRHYHECGELRDEGEYADGLRHGPWTAWAEDGGLYSTGSYDRGKQHGPWTIHCHERVSAEFHDGVPSGIWQYHDPDGPLLKTAQLLDGGASLVKVFDSNGIVVGEGVSAHPLHRFADAVKLVKVGLWYEAGRLVNYGAARPADIFDIFHDDARIQADNDDDT